jgi:hypothetical protein
VPPSRRLVVEAAIGLRIGVETLLQINQGLKRDPEECRDAVSAPFRARCRYLASGRASSRVHAAAVETSSGGIGRHRTFTHVDIGRRRFWNG